MDEEQLILKIKDVLIDQFEIEESIASLDTNPYEELEIDSIDAVDLLVEIKELIGNKISPGRSREVRIIRDALIALTNL